MSFSHQIMLKNPKSKLKSYKFGILAELIVIIFLRLKFYRIIKKRYKTRFGEIDIIASRGKTIVAIEVKARKLRKEEILIETILRKTQTKRIKNAMQYFLANNAKYRDFNVRFDFILITNNYLPQHHQAYWE